MITRTRSSGRECTGIFEFAGILSRTVYRPGLQGLPCSTVVCVPLGIEGSGLHFRSAGVTRSYSSELSPATVGQIPLVTIRANKQVAILETSISLRLDVYRGDSTKSSICLQRVLAVQKTRDRVEPTAGQAVSAVPRSRTFPEPCGSSRPWAPNRISNPSDELKRAP